MASYRPTSATVAPSTLSAPTCSVSQRGQSPPDEDVDQSYPVATGRRVGYLSATLPAQESISDSLIKGTLRWL
jgi:hypothetical protein